MPKTNSTERVRAYRRRQRARNPPKQPPKSGAQRAREFRARRRALKLAGLTGSSLSTPELPATVNLQTFLSNNPSTSSEHYSHSMSQPYTHFRLNETVHREFAKQFIDNPFGFVCSICDRLWFENELRNLSDIHKRLVRAEFPRVNVNNLKACKYCFQTLNRNRIPTLAKWNGFQYPDKPTHLPELDLLSERLISPRLPFMQIRRVRHVDGQYGICGSIINVPSDVDTMVHQLPRHIDDDYCLNVHIERKQVHKSSCLSELIDKRTIKSWLQYLCDSPLYELYDITINHCFFNDLQSIKVIKDEVSEDMIMEESLTAQQYTMLWSDEKYLKMTRGEMALPHSLVFDQHAEELSFPAIYFGKPRVFKKDLRVTPFMMATSELRRADRRGVTPCHLLYLAMKIMRLKVHESLTAALKSIGIDSNMSKEKLQSKEYVKQCLETDFAFLKCIPDSSGSCADTEGDLFAMIRQFGRPTLFLTITANEIGWVPLLKILYRLKNDGNEIADEMISELTDFQKSTLVTEDAVTCVIYFNRLVNVLMTLLQSKKSNAFAEHRVLHFFKRMEFPHDGSPRAHILLWLENAPNDVLGRNKEATITLINKLMTVSTNESSGNIELQTHNHTLNCFKKIASNESQTCHFEAPFMPCRNTTILTPTDKSDPDFVKNAEHYASIRVNLENHDYLDMDTFHEDSGITSDEHYEDILRAGITRPRVFLKRQPEEKWHNAFNPFILNVVQSSIDVKFVLDEYSCAAYIAEYFHKPNQGISNLHRRIIKIIEENSEFDIVKIIKKISTDMLNTVEITIQEAAWYLLRKPTSKSSSDIAYIPTLWPAERQRIRRKYEEMARMGIDDILTDISKENWFDKYQRRPENHEDLSLAQFVANFTLTTGKCIQRKDPRVIRYRHYDMTEDLNEFKREMVTLHLPFRDEKTEILEDMKFIELYDANEKWILQRRMEFESNLNIQKTIEICENLCREEDVDGCTPINGVELAKVTSVGSDPGRKTPNAVEAPQNDIGADGLDKLGAVDRQLIDFITIRKELSASSLNCQSLSMHEANLNGGRMRQSTILVLSETWTRNEEIMDVPNFDWVVKFKRGDEKPRRVNVHRDSSDRVTAVTDHMDVTLRQSSALTVKTTTVGEICAARCTLESGQTIVVVAMYIAPGQEIDDIIDFIHEELLLYTSEGAALFKKDWDEAPMMMSGDFNVGLDEPETQALVEFLEDKFKLEMRNNETGNARSGTIGTVFCRYLEKIKSRTYVSYFGCHKASVSDLSDTRK